MILLCKISTAAQIHTLTDKNNILNRDWAVVRGLHRGVSENTRDALGGHLRDFVADPLTHKWHERMPKKNGQVTKCKRGKNTRGGESCDKMKIEKQHVTRKRGNAACRCEVVGAKKPTHTHQTH